MNHIEILFAEPDKSFLEELETSLSNYGIKIIKATDGVEALQALLYSNPTIIFANINLPIIDGFDVFRSVKENKRTSDIPFIFMSHSHEHQLLEKCKHLNANGFLKTPFDICRLIYVIKQFSEVKILPAQKENNFVI